jgi:hypothetical protein
MEAPCTSKMWVHFYHTLVFYLCLGVLHYMQVMPGSMISGSLSTRHGTSSGCSWRNGLQYCGQLQVYWISSCGWLTRGGPSGWGLGEVLTTTHHKNISCYKMFKQKASDLDWYFGTIKQRKRDSRFGTSNVWSLYKAGSLTAAAARELARYLLGFTRTKLVNL